MDLKHPIAKNYAEANTMIDLTVWV